MRLRSLFFFRGRVFFFLDAVVPDDLALPPPLPPRLTPRAVLLGVRRVPVRVAWPSKTLTAPQREGRARTRRPSGRRTRRDRSRSRDRVRGRGRAGDRTRPRCPARDRDLCRRLPAFGRSGTGLVTHLTEIVELEALEFDLGPTLATSLLAAARRERMEGVVDRGTADEVEAVVEQPVRLDQVDEVRRGDEGVLVGILLNRGRARATCPSCEPKTPESDGLQMSEPGTDLRMACRLGRRRCRRRRRARPLPRTRRRPLRRRRRPGRDRTRRAGDGGDGGRRSLSRACEGRCRSWRGRGSGRGGGRGAG